MRILNHSSKRCFWRAVGEEKSTREFKMCLNVEWRRISQAERRVRVLQGKRFMRGKRFIVHENNGKEVSPRNHWALNVSFWWEM